MRVIEQLVHHFWARGALSREQALFLVQHGFARESDLPGLNAPSNSNANTSEDYGGEEGAGAAKEPDRRAEDEAREAEELEDELVKRNAGGRKGGKKKKPTGHNLAPLITTLSAHFAAREPYSALCELGSRLKLCANWRDAARVIGAARPEALETALVGLLGARPRALGELWFWFDLEPVFEWADDEENAGPVADGLSKLLRADNPAQVGRLGQLLKATEVQMLLDLLPARRAFLNLLPVLYHAYFPRLGLWLVPPAGGAAKCWPALPWAFVLVYNARQGTAKQPPPGYELDPKALAPRLLQMALTTAFAQAPVAVRELLLHGLHDRAGTCPEFARELRCPYTWRV
jgi:hypothetical protein